MRIFVAGATGAIGRPLVRQLKAAGHQVTGITRSAQRAEALRETGADAVVCDVFDRDRLVGVVEEARPDVVIHQLTALPDALDPRRPETLAATNRLRREGTRLLIEAAGGASMIAQSVAFLYAPVGDWVKDETAAVMRGVREPFGDGLAALEDLEARCSAHGRASCCGTGSSSGRGTQYALDGHYANEARRRRLPIVGGGGGFSA